MVPSFLPLLWTSIARTMLPDGRAVANARAAVERDRLAARGGRTPRRPSPAPPNGSPRGRADPQPPSRAVPRCPRSASSSRSQISLTVG